MAFGGESRDVTGPAAAMLFVLYDFEIPLRAATGALAGASVLE